MIEAGLSINNRKFEFDLSANASSGKTAFSRFIEQRSLSPDMADRLSASVQYATILSAGTLNELYQAAVVFSPDMDDMIKKADSSARTILGLLLMIFFSHGREKNLLFSDWKAVPIDITNNNLCAFARGLFEILSFYKLIAILSFLSS